MNAFDIAQLRLANHQLTAPRFTHPAEVAAWFGAIQAQDYAQAKWALGIRVPGATEETIEQAFADKSVVRTSLLRGTLHVVAAADIRWLLTLVGPRRIAACATLYKKEALDDATFDLCKDLLINSLQGGNQLTREELSSVFGQAGIEATGFRLSHIIQRAAFSQLLCYGTRRGASPTFTLLDEWIAPSRPLSREEALAELAKRYFTSHGPATLPDFAWWSGLTLKEAKQGLELNKSVLVCETLDGETYWLSPATTAPQPPNPDTQILAGFDEYVLGYRNRSICLPEAYTRQVITVNGIFNPTIVQNGRVLGTWARMHKKDSVVVTKKLFGPVSQATDQEIQTAAERYSHFVRKPLVVAENGFAAQGF
ncbi:winged helix DNA-binding domain-containing protein [Hymenobacter jejuensis]|uniref:Winged helix DNA-binding domain-containing protein n=1 Tax=Hymenobacter jejuensis TaxID=2502781 RepID=A0A5B7ZVN6_9BACT|nr:winged helix DNA-binding domain-containing protein [Hymenobacter jejuensis]QDA59294.1 winged helix DNA-binding domain-containing protein [Hymenobacter jejuensis]